MRRPGLFVLPALLALALSLGCAFLPLRADSPLSRSIFSGLELNHLVGKPAPPLSLLLADGTAKTLADYRGRWVLLSFSETWCPPSENVGIVGSEIQEELKDRPFDFIQVSFAPTADDDALETFRPFQGAQAVPASHDELDAWDIKSVPSNFLIDPDGNVVLANQDSRAKTLRASLAKPLRNPLSLPPDFTSVTSRREAEEKALFTYFTQDREEALPLFKALLEKDPADAWARAWVAKCITGKEDGLTDDAWLARELQDPARATEPLRFLLASLRMDHWKNDDAALLLPPLQEKRPKSLLLQAYRIALAKRPPETTRDELRVLLAVQGQYPPVSLRAHALMAAELLSASTPPGPEAEALSASIAAAARHLEFNSGAEKSTLPPLDAFASSLFHRENWTQEFLASYDARRGRLNEAVEIMAKRDDGITPATSDRASSYSALWHHAAILDWKGALPYAAKHTQTTPWNAAGAVVRLIAALRMKDAAAKEAAVQELLNFKTDRKAYLYAQKVMRGEADVTDEDIRSFKGDSYGFVGLLWAAAALEASGKPEASLQALDRELRARPVDDLYSLLFTLRDALKKSLPPGAGG